MRDVIASPDNKFYKLLKKLDKKKYRDENSIFKAEGEKFLNENINFNKIIVKESRFEYFDERYEIAKHDNLTILKDNLFDEVSTQENSQGIIFSQRIIKMSIILGSRLEISAQKGLNLLVQIFLKIKMVYIFGKMKLGQEIMR